MLETIQYYDETYLNAFLTIHFYGLIYDNLINDKLKFDWDWQGTNHDTPIYVQVFEDYTYDELVEELKNYILSM